MQVCTSLQTDNHANTSLLSFLQAGCPSCRPTNSVKALKAFFNKMWEKHATISVQLPRNRFSVLEKHRVNPNIYAIKLTEKPTQKL